MMWTDDPVRDAENYYEEETNPCEYCVSQSCRYCSHNEEYDRWEDDYEI